MGFRMLFGYSHLTFKAFSPLWLKLNCIRNKYEITKLPVKMIQKCVTIHPAYLESDSQTSLHGTDPNLSIMNHL